MATTAIPRLVIAGTHSGVGKTTLTAGLVAALCRRGLTVQPFKAGPDYIDPTYHSLAAGRPCRNLDTWMVPPDRVRALFAHAAGEADIAIVEGVMGLYDGFGYENETGSTAELAKLLGAPVVLVLDAGQMARSAGALALGYQQYDPELSVAGFIANRVAGESHGEGVAAAIRQATGLPVLGWLPYNSALEIPERHLGLVPTAEPGRWRTFIEAAADHVACHLDLDRLLAIARDGEWREESGRGKGRKGIREQGNKAIRKQGAFSLVNLFPYQLFPSSTLHPPIIAVARDEAFSFTYEDNLDLLRAAGAEIVFFSPLRDAALPPKTAGVILSGGFPELYADQLAANNGMRDALREAHQQNMPIYAECGGLMYLTGSITDLDGREHPMVGLLPGRSVMAGQLTMGYRLARAAGDSWLFAAGETVRGHEFHYSVWEERPADTSTLRQVPRCLGINSGQASLSTSLPPAYILLPRDGRGEPQPEGARLGSLWASYVHLHFWTRPELAIRFVEACCQGGSSDAFR